jgi:diguanylate cyclase (GGDEF)-like protein
MIWFYLLLAAGALAWWLRRRARPSRDSRPSVPTRTGPAEITFARLSGESPRLPTPLPQETLLAAFRSDEMPTPEHSEREDILALARALSLVADHLGARDCVLWRRDLDDADRVIPVAASRGREPDLNGSELALVQWCAQEGVATGDTGGEQHVRLLVAPVVLNGIPGALSVHFAGDATKSRTELREWLTRHAENVSTLVDIVRTRAESARRNKKLRSMIRTAKTLQGSRDPIALEQMLVRDSLIMSDGEWGLLVRWDAGLKLGTVKVATDGAPSFGVRVTARQSSLIGEVCLSAVPRVFSDARGIEASREPIFDDAPLPAGTGSLVIVPLQRGDNEPVLGALVVGHSQLRALQMNDAHALRELGVIAAGALETAWSHQAETERARTDQLTGLANRRSFEESFTKMIGETDRYGGSAALVLCDVDFFKKVNDTYGHETGDQVLIAVANALESGRRTTDSVARVGGEELALLLPQTDSTGAMEVAERTRAMIEALVVPTEAGDIRITASFGVAMYTARSGTGGKLYERADRALYAAKNGGRNRVELAAGEGAWSGT